MKKKAISTTEAPAAIGPYSQAVEGDCLLFVSGQIPLDPKTGVIVEGDIKAQTRQALENVKKILEAASLRMENVVKTTVYITNMKQFGAMNEVYGTYFAENPPARSAVEVGALPKGAMVEIEVIASKK